MDKSGTNKVHNLTQGSEAVEPSVVIEPQEKPAASSLAYPSIQEEAKQITPSINGYPELGETLAPEKNKAAITETVQNPDQPKDRKKAMVRFRS